MLKTKFKYISEIDFLRAVAVSFVIFFHLNNNYFPAGYLGVDIFFVISGFVISQSLYKKFFFEKDNSIINFYIRRIKRLFPALIFMIVINTIIYFFFGYTRNGSITILSSITSIFGLSNLFLLFTQSDYFLQHLTNPFQHTWSLGVEEQFYLIYPFFFLFFISVFSQLKEKFLFFLIITSSLSLLIFFLFHKYSIGNFYSPIARFWEIGTGCIIFFLTTRYKLNNINFVKVSVLILTINILSIYYFEYLQLNILITVLTTALIIYTISISDYKLKIFNNKYIIYIGKISYSLYLWHLPLIYFCDMYLSGIFFYFLFFILLFFISSFSYLYIEIPFKRNLNFDLLLKKTLLPITIILFFAGYFFALNYKQYINFISDNFILISNKYNFIEKKNIKLSFFDEILLINNNPISEFCNSESKKYSSQNNDFRPECFLNIKPYDQSKSLMLLSGDSHAFHFLPMVLNNDKFNDLYLHDFPSCILINKAKCKDNEKKVNFNPNNLTLKYDNVYIFHSWWLADPFRFDIKRNFNNIEKFLEDYINNIDSKIQITFIAPVPYFYNPPHICVINNEKCFTKKEEDLIRRNKIYNIYNNLVTKYNNVHMFDPYKFLCPDDLCFIYNDQNKFLYKDNHHLTILGANILIEPFNQWLTINFKK